MSVVNKPTGLQPSRAASPPAGTSCGVCKTAVSVSALCCSKCSKYVHVKCSRLPRYVVLNFFTTRCAFTCESCILARDSNTAEMRAWLDSVFHSSPSAKADEYPLDKPADSQSLQDLTKTVNEIKQQLQLVCKQKLSSPLLPTPPSLMPTPPSLLPTPTSLLPTPTSCAVQQPRTYSQAVSREIIVKSSDEVAVDSKRVSEALQSVPVLAMTTTKRGAVKVKLPDSKTVGHALKAIKHVAHLKTSCPGKVLPKLTITSVSSDIANDNITEFVSRKNSLVKAAVNRASDFRVLFSKKSSEHTKTVVVAVSPTIRDIIMKSGFVYLGDSRCLVYDRFWVTRCIKCQRHGHKSDKCRAQEATCGWCAGKHTTKSCPAKNARKCINCARAGRANVGHTSFDPSCPCFTSSRTHLISRTQTVEDSNSEN